MSSSPAERTAVQSRAAAAAQRRIMASQTRRRTASEVMLVASKAFPSQAHQELLNLIKGLQLPPDVSALFTTVRAERVAERKAGLSTHSPEGVDAVLHAAGSKLSILAEASEELGLGATRDGTYSPALPRAGGLPCVAGRTSDL